MNRQFPLKIAGFESSETEQMFSTKQNVDSLIGG